MNDSTYCPLPFVHPFFDVRGMYTPCCNANNFSLERSVKNLNFQDWFYGEEMESLRKDLLQGKQNDMCKTCWQQERQGLESPRKKAVEYWADKNVNVNNPIPRFFDLKPTNVCNLACVFCNSYSSSLIGDIVEKNENNIPTTWLTSHNNYVKNIKIYKTFDEKIIDYIKNNSANIDMLRFTGGEPFLNDSILEILNIISVTNPNADITITTNGTAIREDYISLLQKFTKCKIKFSIDGMEDLYNFIRWPSTWKKLQKKINNTMTNLNNVNFNINFLITAMNIEQLPEIRNWFYDLKEQHSNLDFITLDHSLSPKDSYFGINIFDKDTLIEIYDYLKVNVKSYNLLDYKCDRQFQFVLNRLNYMIYNYKPTPIDLKKIKEEMVLFSRVRNMDYFKIIKPITAKFYMSIK